MIKYKESPAYLVYFDALDGQMEVWCYPNIEAAAAQCVILQEKLESHGYASYGHYRALTKLPHKKIYKFHE